MASAPIVPWQIEGEEVKIVTDFLFLGSEITADTDCSHDIGRQLLLGRKAMTNLDSVLKSKVRTVKAVVFPVVMYSCESWTVKKAECQRIDTFKLWCWRRLLKVPWTSLDCIFTGRTNAEDLVFWSWCANRPFIGKVPGARKD